MEPLIRVKKHVPSGTIILNRPDKRNPLSRQMIDDLRQALDDLHQERKVRAVILTGAGSSFCSGADLQEIQDSSRQNDAWAQWHSDAVQYKELLEAMLLYPKPIIAAVNGPAVGSGAGLVLAADITLATPEARFGLPEPRRGLVAGLVAPLLSFPNWWRSGSEPAADGPFSRGQRSPPAGDLPRTDGFRDHLGTSPPNSGGMCPKCSRIPPTDQENAERNDRRAPEHHASCGSRRQRDRPHDRSRRRGSSRLLGKTRTQMAVRGSIPVGASRKFGRHRRPRPFAEKLPPPSKSTLADQTPIS